MIGIIGIDDRHHRHWW